MKFMQANGPHAGKPTWEGPQFTDWARLHQAVVDACNQFNILIVEGYLVLDAFEWQPSLYQLFDCILWVNASFQLVVQRRTEYPRYGSVKWSSAKEYAEHCVWPIHVAYEARVAQANIFATHSKVACLPEVEGQGARLQRAHTLICGWFAELSIATATLSGPLTDEQRAFIAAKEAAAKKRRDETAARQQQGQMVPPPQPTLAVPPPQPTLAVAPPQPTLAPTMSRARPVLLVTHGSVNPVHLGHVTMMVRARAALEAEGFHVTNGIIGITHARHILKKFKEQKKHEVPIADATRLRLLELACEPHSSWLRHCGGHGVEVGSARQLANKLKSVHPPNVLFATVEGSDVFERYPGRYDIDLDYLRVVVARDGALQAARQQRAKFTIGCGKIKILPPDQSLAAASSTSVRAAVVGKDRATVVAMCGEAVGDALLPG